MLLCPGDFDQTDDDRAVESAIPDFLLSQLLVVQFRIADEGIGRHGGRLFNLRDDLILLGPTFAWTAPQYDDRDFTKRNSPRRRILPDRRYVGHRRACAQAERPGK